jgi:hypothetical protein
VVAQEGSQLVFLALRRNLEVQLLQVEAVRHSAQLAMVHLSDLQIPFVILYPSLQKSQLVALLLQTLQFASEQMG